MIQRKTAKKCTECASKNLFLSPEKGELFCRDCGIVVEDHIIDFSVEGYANNESGEDRRSRGTGRPAEIGTPSKMATQIGNYRERRAFKEKGRGMVWVDRPYIGSKTALERNLQVAEEEMKRICCQLHFTKQMEKQALQLYYDCACKGLAKGRKIETLVAGVLYFVAKQFGVARTLDEFSGVVGIGKREIGRVYRYVVKEMKLNAAQSSPADYLPRFAASLKLPAEVQTKAVELLERAKDKELTSGRGPAGLAAAALYIAGLMNGEKRTQREVADVAGVTEVTIRNRYKELVKELRIRKVKAS